MRTRPGRHGRSRGAPQVPELRCEELSTGAGFGPLRRPSTPRVERCTDSCATALSACTQPYARRIRNDPPARLLPKRRTNGPLGGGKHTRGPTSDGIRTVRPHVHACDAAAMPLCTAEAPADTAVGQVHGNQRKKDEPSRHSSRLVTRLPVTPALSVKSRSAQQRYCAGRKPSDRLRRWDA